jgi:hypothetical protein
MEKRKKNNTIFKLFICTSAVLFNLSTYAQLVIDRVTPHQIRFHYENNSDRNITYFDPNCFLLSKKVTKERIRAVLAKDRSNLRNDTLFIFIHDINFKNSSQYSSYESCRLRGDWKFKELLPHNKSENYSIVIKNNIKYKVLAIHYATVLEDTSYSQATYCKKSKEKQYYYDNIPIMEKGQCDSIFKSEKYGHFGLGFD